MSDHPRAWRQFSNDGMDVRRSVVSSRQRSRLFIEDSLEIAICSQHFSDGVQHKMRIACSIIILPLKRELNCLACVIAISGSRSCFLDLPVSMSMLLLVNGL